MKPPIGTWYCHTVDQFQSEESKAHGVHPDDSLAPPQPANETEYRDTVLEIGADGRYAIRGTGMLLSGGTWSLDGSTLSFAEDPNEPGAFEKVVRIVADARSIKVDSRLIPDAHDGLDVLSLEFKNKPLKLPKAAKTLEAAGVLEMVAAGKWKTRQQAKLDELPVAERLAIYRAAWDGLIAGTFANDREARSFREQIEFLAAGARHEPTAPTHRHIAHSLRTFDEERRWLLANGIVTAISRLPASAEDATVADAMSAPWLVIVAPYRFMGGMPRVWDRPLFPQPAFDDACRAFLAKSIFGGNFEDAVQLFEGRPGLALALLRHYGNGALTRSNAAIRERGLEADARAAAVTVLTAVEPRGAAIVNNAEVNTERLGALAFAVLFREGPELPAVALASLAHGGQGYSRYVMTADDKAVLRASAESLPDEAKALVTAAFYL